MSDDLHCIGSEEQLRAIIGEPMDFVRAKIGQRLNGAMEEFIRRSPLTFVSTIDESGNPDISPKGDPAGFALIEADNSLLIPERPGNRLTFGFSNILRDARVGLIFIVPNQLETLRIKGRASLHSDPDLLERMEVSGKPAILFMRIRIEECFFHCGKALVRSHLWDPAQWEAQDRSIAARQFAPGEPPNEAGVKLTEAALERSYREELY